MTELDVAPLELKRIYLPIAKKNHRKLGLRAEEQAKQYLVNKGYRFVTANFSSRMGEIDLIFEHNNQLVFVEVKARFNTMYGHPAEFVNHHKLKRIVLTGQYFMNLYPNLPRSARIDVIAIVTSGTDIIEHYENVCQ